MTTFDKNLKYSKNNNKKGIFCLISQIVPNKLV